jgi:hypothetical protein
MITMLIGISSIPNLCTLESPPCHPTLKKAIWTTARRSNIKIRQRSSTSHSQWLARETMLTRWPPWTVLLPQTEFFGAEDHCDLPWHSVEDHCCRHQPGIATVPAQCPTRVICWWWTFHIWVMVMRWLWLDVADMEVECGLWLYGHSFDTFAVELLQCVMSHLAAPDPGNQLLKRKIISGR